MKASGVDFLTKPASGGDLIVAIEPAISRDTNAQRTRSRRRARMRVGAARPEGMGPKGNTQAFPTGAIFAQMLREPLRVCIVDDEPSVRTALARLLKTQSFDATGFGSAADFIDSLEGGLPDCLVVDFHMPGMTGLELQQYLLQVDKMIPTVVISAHDDPILRQLCKSFGASDFLCKPLSNSVLIRAIRKAIDHGF